MKTKLILIGMAAAMLLSAPLAAQAADLPQYRPSYKAPEPAYMAPIFSWTGFYFGVNGGYGFGKSDWAIPAVSPSPKGFVAGGTLGYNLQTGTWVWGIEGDFDWANMNNSVGCGVFSCETSTDWFATARLRLGYAGWGNWMPYITGGGAGASVKASNSAFGDASKTKFGWTAGAGIEFAFVGNWTAKAEYLYADLGSFDCTGACGGPAISTDDVTFKASLVRLGVNYRF